MDTFLRTNAAQVFPQKETTTLFVFCHAEMVKEKTDTEHAK